MTSSAVVVLRALALTRDWHPADTADMADQPAQVRDPREEQNERNRQDYYRRMQTVTQGSAEEQVTQAALPAQTSTMDQDQDPYPDPVADAVSELARQTNLQRERAVQQKQSTAQFAGPGMPSSYAITGAQIREFTDMLERWEKYRRPSHPFPGPTDRLILETLQDLADRLTVVGELAERSAGREKALIELVNVLGGRLDQIESRLERIQSLGGQIMAKVVDIQKLEAQEADDIKVVAVNQAAMAQNIKDLQKQIAEGGTITEADLEPLAQLAQQNADALHALATPAVEAGEVGSGGGQI